MKLQFTDKNLKKHSVSSLLDAAAGVLSGADRAWHSYVRPEVFKIPRTVNEPAARCKLLANWLQRSSRRRCLVLAGSPSREDKLLLARQIAAYLKLPLCMLPRSVEELRSRLVRISPETGKPEYGEVLKTIRAGGILVCSNFNTCGSGYQNLLCDLMYVMRGFFTLDVNG